jgi:hypothetical protein
VSARDPGAARRDDLRCSQLVISFQLGAIVPAGRALILDRQKAKADRAKLLAVKATT